jgi:hypothetical protein
MIWDFRRKWLVSEILIIKKIVRKSDEECHIAD